MPAPADEFAPASTAELARFLQENAAAARQPVIPSGGRTALRIGEPVPAPARLLSMTSMHQVIDYPARDMTITVEAGLRISEFQRLLSAERQRLPIDVPDARRATLGGAIACNASGPRRFGHGTLRDYVIGISAVDGTGRPWSAGGRVVKNVAGYDLCKLLVGSLGTLSVITQLTLKLRPLAEAQRVLWLGSSSIEQVGSWLEALNQSATRPVAIELFNRIGAQAIAAESRQDVPHADFAVAVAFEGNIDECRWQMETSERELAPSAGVSLARLGDDQAAALLGAMCEFQAAGDDPVTFHASMRPSEVPAFVHLASQRRIAIQAHAGNGVVIGHLPDDCVSAESAANLVRPLRSLAETNRGSLVVWNCEEDWKPVLSVFGSPRTDRRWMREVKHALDPHNLLSPGRLPLSVSVVP